MTTLYIDRKGLSLRADSSALAFYDESGRVGTVPLKVLERVCIRGDVQLSAQVLGKLGEHGVGLVVLSGRQRKPVLMMPNVKTDARRREAQFALAADPAFCLQISCFWLQAKLGGQLAWLQALSQESAALRAAMYHHMANIEHLIAQLPQAATLEALRGMEGAAAAHYFAALALKLPDSLKFHGRNRQPPKDPFNSVLSLGYTLLHFEWVRQIYLAGLDPFCGFLHTILPGRESLACDLLEPFRPLYDQWAWQLFAEGVLRPEDFSSARDRCDMGKPARLRYYAAFETAAKLWRPKMHAAIMTLLHKLGQACPHTDADCFTLSEWQVVSKPETEPDDALADCV